MTKRLKKEVRLRREKSKEEEIRGGGRLGGGSERRGDEGDDKWEIRMERR